MKRSRIDYRGLRLRRLREPQYSHLLLIIGWVVYFALYFLTVSQRGYCVHYASALTALLQARGIPARFVIGYAFTVASADTWVEVTDRNAHAWTEVYVDGWEIGRASCRERVLW